MKNFVFLLFALLIFVFNACHHNCTKVSGPNDVSYNSVSPPDCTAGTFTVNSIADFDLYCPGGATPTAWDFTNKTYFIINKSYCSVWPYLADVGNDPSDGNTIVVTLGIPCDNGSPRPQNCHPAIFGIEVTKTTKSFVVVEKNEGIN